MRPPYDPCTILHPENGRWLEGEVLQDKFVIVIMPVFGRLGLRSGEGWGAGVGGSFRLVSELENFSN